ncbi:MAG: hypothetical protein IMZ55_11015 [Acidobacteria bacterium]|nr:hypothetical protein [Acidobacteriota bacterium]
MTEIKEGNWSHRQPPLKDGDVILDGNFSQLVPGTILCPGVRDVIVKEGNFVNCDKTDCLARGWKIESPGGNWAQVERCSHVHPEWVERGLPVCAEDCEHRVSAVKGWQEVSEPEFRAVKADARVAKPGTPTARIVEAVDIDGMKTQKLQVEKYRYEDKGIEPKVGK